MSRKILENELEDLQFDILRMGSHVEKAISDSVKALLNDDLALANEVIEADDLIDQLNIAVQDKCIRLLALRNPMATDLRIIETDLQIATDLERMGDYAESIARIAVRLHGRRTIPQLAHLNRLADMVKDLVHNIVTAYILGDISLAKEVVDMEEKVDGHYKEYFEIVLQLIKEDPNTAEMGIQLLFAGHNLERIADHSTNIGESVFYMITGVRTVLNF